MCDCLPKMLCVYCIYIYIYHVNKFEARLLFLYLPLKKFLLKIVESCSHISNYYWILLKVPVKLKTLQSRNFRFQKLYSSDSQIFKSYSDETADFGKLKLCDCNFLKSAIT